MPAEPFSRFDQAVTVRRLGPGRYAAAVDPGWSGPVAPNGGVLAATMIRAAQAELGPGAPPLRSISAHYLAAPAAGAIELQVEPLRVGKRVTFVDVRMRQHDQLVAQATIIGSTERPTDTAMASEPPLVPAFDEVAAIEGSVVPGEPPIFDRLEMRPVFGAGIFSGASEAVTGGWLAFRDDAAPLDAARLCALTDLWWPAVFTARTSLVGIPTLQLTVHLRSTRTEVHWPVLARYESRNALEGHVDESGEVWSADGRLLAESRQLALLLPFPRELGG